MSRTIYPILSVLLLLSACTTGVRESEPSNTPFQATSTSIPNEITALPTKTQTIVSPASPEDTKTPSPLAQTTPTAITPTVTTTPAENTSTPEPDTDTQAIIIDHTSVELFERIPERYLTAARELRLMFSDRSVGQNINEALNCLTAPSWDKSPVYCRVDYVDSNWNFSPYNLSDKLSGNVPLQISFEPDPVQYNRANWIFEFKGGGWSELTQDFIENLAPAYMDTTDVLTYQFTYLNVTEHDDIADPNIGFFADTAKKSDIYDLEAFLANHPDKIFFFWTTSLARGIGTKTSTDFNNQMRQYVIEQGKILFDVADIESHTAQGAPCFDNRDGVEYCSQNKKCENYPDDGEDYPAICQDYTTETDGGHLGSVSGGAIRIAKAFWVLMARIAGWDGEVIDSP